MRAACGAGRHVRPDLSGADTVKERPPVKMNPASPSTLTVMADDAVQSSARRTGSGIQSVRLNLMFVLHGQGPQAPVIHLA